MKETGKSFDMDPKTFTLASIFRMELYNFADVIRYRAHWSITEICVFWCQTFNKINSGTSNQSLIKQHLDIYGDLERAYKLFSPLFMSHYNKVFYFVVVTFTTKCFDAVKSQMLPQRSSILKQSSRTSQKSGRCSNSMSSSTTKMEWTEAGCWGQPNQ